MDNTWLSTISTMLTREQFLLEEIASFMPVDLMPICHQPFLCITTMCSVTAHDWVTATIIWANLDDEKLSDCAKEFKGQYGDVTKHSCPAYSSTLSDLNKEIGKTGHEIIQMNGTRPVRPQGWNELECVWEYHILGLWSIGERVGGG